MTRACCVCARLLLSGYPEYLGCYADNAASRVLPFNANNDQVLRYVSSSGQAPVNASLDTCFSAALAGGYGLFGAQFGGECWLGNDTTLATSLGASNECSIPCWGNKTQICGGNRALSLYRVRGMAAVIAS